MQVSESGYYRWRSNRTSFREQRDNYLISLIKQIHSSVKGRYGSPRIYQVLKDQGEQVSRKRVNRLMRENNIYAKTKLKYKATTDSKHNNAVAPNLLEQNFKTSSPNKVWVSDITFIMTCEGWLYLVVIIDLYSRKVVGWSVSDRINKELIIDSFLKAYNSRKPNPGLIHHSDRGSQYASKEFQKLLKNVGAKCSMSGKGNCYDNAVAESFFNSLKTESLKEHNFKTREEAKSVIFAYIETFYNRVRKHSTLNYCSPINFEQYSEKVA